MLALRDVKQRLLRESATLVDVRPSIEFDRYRIAGSLNIPLHLIKTKAFLRTGTTILVNNGHSAAELESGCAELRKAGFANVAILDGGLYGWHAAHEELAADPAALSALDRLSPQEMFLERSGTDWLVLELGDMFHKDLDAWLPTRREQIELGGERDLASRMSATITRHRQANSALRFVIVAANDAAYEQFEPSLREAGHAWVFYLAGGAEGYADFVRNQVAMWNQRSQRPEFPSCHG